MITIHNANTIDFSNNGLGVLEPLSCILNLEINGGWSLEMEYPLDPDGKYLKIEEGKIIKVTGIGVVREQTEPYQLFRIYYATKGLNSLKVIAFPVAFEATYDAVVDEYSTGSSEKTINSLLNDSANGLMKKLSDEGVTKYTCSVDYEDCPTYKNDWKNTNLIAIISGSDENSILNKYDAEVAYDNYSIRINHKLGEETDFEVRYGKNLTGLDVDTDTSGVVTRFYPISKEGIRYKGANNEAYIESDEFPQYPFARCAFIQTDYPLVDTNEKSYSNAAILTREAKATIIEDITTVMESIWGDIKSGNKVNNQLYETEWMQKSLNDIIAEVQASTTLIPADSDAGLANLFRTCIKSGINWIKDEDIADYEWKTVSNNKYYGNSDRDLKSQYYYIDKMYRWFDENGIYHPEKDLNTMDWLNHIGQQQIGTPTKGFGNDTSTIARDAWVFTMDGVNQTGSNFNQYYFDADGCWDGVSEASEWDWQQTDNKWWFGKTGATDPKDYAHDEWVYIYKSSGTAPSNSPKLYYFGSDGYVLYDKSCSWNWYENKQKWYFGVAVTESNRIYLKNQWMKIDGDWYYFNNQELVAKDKTIRLGLVNYIVSQINNLGDFSEYTTRLYNRLYQSMYEYCESLYDEEGYDKPSITVTANVVDLSKTTEYEDFPDLMTIHLGDKVKVIDYVHYPDFEYNLRVVGLQYDCIRGYNTQVTIGDLSKKVSQMISANLGGKGEKLVAGENVTIDGNTINAMTNVGDIYAGSQVDVEQIVHSGTEIAKIYVDGYPTSIYASGADVQVQRYLTEGTPTADIIVNGVHNEIYSDGLQYWHETSEQIWREGVTDGLQADSNFFKDDTEFWEITRGSSGSSSRTYHRFKKKNETPAIYGMSSDHSRMIVVSTKSDAIELEWQRWWSVPAPDGQWNVDFEHPAGTWGDVTTTTPYYEQPSSSVISFEYMGVTWYARVVTGIALATESGIHEYTGSGNDSNVESAKKLIDYANGTPNRPDKEGISNQDHILFYNSYPNDPNHEDDVFVSKSGVFHGSRFEDTEGNPISGGGLSKTELYSGSEYVSSIVLSEAYTGYQFLLIQTYNADDKEALSTMLNVSDLVTGSRIGINDYLLYTLNSTTSLSFYSSFDDTNHTRHIKGIYGLKTFNGSDVPNIITDVKDGDTSVVSGGVAQIGGKQDKLTAGQNIQIAADGKTISATDTTYNEFAGSAAGLVPSVQTQAGKFLKDDGTWDTASGASSIDTLTDVNLTSLANGQILKYNSTSQKWENVNEVSYGDFAGSTHGLVPEVQTQSGKFLKDDGTWDEPEGTIVVANPSGSATANLTKLQVDNTIYSIPSGGDLSDLNNWGIFVSYDDITETITAGDILYDNYIAPKASHHKDKKFFLNSVQIIGYDSNNTAYNNLEYAVWQVADMSNSYGVFYWIHNNSNATIVKYRINVICAVPTVSGGGGGGASALDDLTDVDVSAPTNGQVLTYNSTSQQWENATPSGGASYTDVTGTLSAGSTSITLSDASIDSTKTFDFYTDTFGVNPTAVSVSSGSITLTFEAQQSNIEVKVRVW